jgi:hypothetical protein
MRFLGKIVRLQIQPTCLKHGEGEGRVYSPEALMPAQRLELTGACSLAPDGSSTIDIHNSSHPNTRNHGANALSFAFTSHYSAMQARFGDHLGVGCAGENILIEAEQVISLEQVARGVAIETAQGRVALGNVVVATPCNSFSKYALRASSAAPADVKAALQFLDQGMRGYYCQFASDSPATVMLGDRVFAV